MDFFLVGFVLWGLIVAAAFLFIWGIWKKSWRAFFWSGAAFFIPALILSSQGGFFILFLFLAIFAFALSFYMKKRF